MEGKYEPKQRDISNQQVPAAKDVFYANGLNIDINPTELILTFDQLLPGSEPEAKSIIMNASAIYQLRDAFNSMIAKHEDILKENSRNDSRNN